MTRAFAKSNRIGQVERLLLNSRVPLSQAEIARRCEVHRSTIGRLIQDMIEEGIPIRTTEDDLIFIERTAYISKIHLKLHEALSTFLACRLLARYSDKPNAHTVTTLEKLGVSLQAVMPALGLHIGGTTTALHARLPKEASDYQRTLEKLTEAWAEGVKVRIWYRPLKARKAFQHTFAPYFLEPSAIGYSTYVIGLAEPPNAIRTRKLERIERIEVTDEPFTVPPDFDANALLAGAWGIWFDEGDQPTTVRLRFSGDQAMRRVGETVWHPSQRTEPDPDGGLLWTAEIDEPKEMLPWIRGWGADCEVREPLELRDQVMGEIRRQMRAYALGTDERSTDALVAHTPPPGGGGWHLLVDHLTRVAELARGFAEPFGAGPLAYQLGLWHDVGKANPAFQAYLRRCHADPKQKGRGPDHKAAGAALAEQHMPPALALLMQGHHGGLHTITDCKTWLDMRQKEDGDVIPAAITQMRQLLANFDPASRLPAPPYLRDQRSFEFFLRMLFSTLVDADFLDTEAHFQQNKAKLRDSDVTLVDLLARFEFSQTEMTSRDDTEVNHARDKLYHACIAAAEQPPGLFRLAIPTGGGKTRSAMAFALRHALKHGQKRIIVAVPFISITEQTADVYRDIFQTEDDDRVVLEHHSGDSRHSEVDDYSPQERWKRLAAENWDAPIVVTTTVQLFESLFANQTGRCRKLHRMAGSVIILDEVQALPPHLLTPILDGLKQLCTNYGTTVVLSTATQPAFESIPAFSDLAAREIVPDATRWFAALKRVAYDWRVANQMSWFEVAELLRGERQSLAVVNTKKDALALLDALGDSDALHLSTLLCGAHRREVIATVKERLSNGQPCRLVSTQVIEAGVDLDFPLVLRAMGPLDRVIQAAGRCNREGKLPGLGQVIVFDPVEGGLPPGPYKAATNITRAMIGTGTLDPDSPEEVRRYFRQVFATLNLDTHKIQALREGRDFPQVAAQFRMIEDDTESVIVTSYGSAAGRELVRADIAALQANPTRAREILRRLQPYMVALRRDLARRYRTSGLIGDLLHGDSLPDVGIWHGVYHETHGLVPDDDRSLLII